MAKDKKSVIKKVILAVAAVIIVVILAGGVYCISTSQTPAEALNTMTSSKSELIVGKWQSQENPGMSAFVFYDDGTYDSYLSNVNFSGEYEVDGGKLYLKNPSTSKEIVYKFSVNENELTLTVYEEDGEEPENEEISHYDRVDELNQKSIADLIGEIAGEVNTTEEDEETE